MESFETPEPIKARIDICMGNIQVIASTRQDTAVTVAPSRKNRSVDERLVEETTVEYLNGQLTVKTPRNWERLTIFWNPGSVDVTVEVPAGSSVNGSTGMGAVSYRGPLDVCEASSGMGDISVEDAKSLHAKTGYGDIVAGNINGEVSLGTGSGSISMGVVKGDLKAKNGNGDIRADAIDGEARFTTGNGKIEIERSFGTISMKTGNGSLKIGDIRSGNATMHTGNGSVKIGIGKDVRAWLDISTDFGTVRNSVTPALDARETAKVTARTSYGDVSIERAAG